MKKKKVDCSFILLSEQYEKLKRIDLYMRFVRRNIVLRLIKWDLKDTVSKIFYNKMEDF